VLHVTQLIGHAARLLYLLKHRGSWRYLGKFRLYGGGMNALLVKQRLYLLSNALVLQQTATSDVRCGDDAIA